MKTNSKQATEKSISRMAFKRRISSRPSYATATLQFAISTFSFVHYKVNRYSGSRIKSPQNAASKLVFLCWNSVKAWL